MVCEKEREIGTIMRESKKGNLKKLVCETEIEREVETILQITL